MLYSKTPLQIEEGLSYKRMERAIIKKRKGDKQQHMYSMPYVMYDKQDRTLWNKFYKA